LSIGELADQAGVTPRTIRYYVELGLLPPPSGPGPKAEYSDEHLKRLLFIKGLQIRRLSLEEIRAYLKEEDGAPLDMPEDMPGPAPASSAADYVAEMRSMYRMSLPDRQLPQLSAQRADNFVGEPWMRIPITADVELNVRRRGSRIDTRLAKAIEELKRILSEKEDQE
jgi:Ca-activated chloride channel family protein